MAGRRRLGEPTEFQFATICPRTPLAGLQTVHVARSAPLSGSQAARQPIGAPIMARSDARPAFIARRAALEPRSEPARSPRVTTGLNRASRLC